MNDMNGNNVGRVQLSLYCMYDVLYINISNMWFKHPCIILTLLSLGVVDLAQSDFVWENEDII